MKDMLTDALGPGVHDISAEIYHSDPCQVPSMSSTLARLMLGRSPRHAWTAHPRLNPDFQSVDKKTFDIGRAAHRAVLGKGGDFVAYPEHVLAKNGAASTTAAKEWAEEIRARGMTPVKSDEYEVVNDMAAEIMARLAFMGIAFPPARSELTVIAEIDGVMCRAMIDHAPEDPRQPLWDLKTTTDASPDAVMRAIMAYGYDIQAAHYCEVWKAATGEDRTFRFVFVEKEAPNECCVVQLGGDTMLMGRKRTARARDMWRHCVTTGQWPGYPAEIVQLELPEFYQARWLERETFEAEVKNATGRDVLASAYMWQAPENHGDNPWA
ncbi:PD-(D/E)XK nuclease-like domain-containing protein [Paracoccus sp. (in: a-proteobacteria)]|uniref:PD-(D/E)XK nuclease-like domain-containing protein n=1 Tax=Paracoccus sp. TaxID=267 RepID=UPI0028AC0EF9|nr:PD-(D/E)XK nuclease-like domain-containing protein [Paracoccus sp. (in: a-proteobacteria)]